MGTCQLTKGILSNKTSEEQQKIVDTVQIAMLGIKRFISLKISSLTYDKYYQKNIIHPFCSFGCGIYEIDLHKIIKKYNFSYAHEENTYNFTEYYGCQDNYFIYINYSENKYIIGLKFNIHTGEHIELEERECLKLIKENKNNESKTNT